jgi:antitoxin-like ribbon-helix-helix protein
VPGQMSASRCLCPCLCIRTGRTRIRAARESRTRDESLTQIHVCTLSHIHRKERSMSKFAAALNAKTGTPVNAASKPDSQAAEAVRAGAREGAKHIGGYFTPAVFKQLRSLAVVVDTTVAHNRQQTYQRGSSRYGFTSSTLSVSISKGAEKCSCTTIHVPFILR